MRSLVTGATGFIGLPLVEWLTEQFGKETIQAAVSPPQNSMEEWRATRLVELGVTRLPIDLRKRPVFSQLPQPFDTLFHLAGYVKAEEPSLEVRINDQGMEWMLEELGQRLQGKRVVFTSSIAAVDPSPPFLGMMDHTTPCRPRIPYGNSKLVAERIVREYAKRFGFTYTILRLPTVYGPDFRPGGMFAFLSDGLLYQKLSARIKWPGRMSIIKISDTVRLLSDAALHPDSTNRTFFVSSGEDPTFNEMAQWTAYLLGIPYRSIPLPPWLFHLLTPLVNCWRIWKYLPHRMMILAWRASLVLQGFYCDGRELTNLLNFSYVPWKEGFRRMYGPKENRDGTGIPVARSWNQHQKEKGHSFV